MKNRITRLVILGILLTQFAVAQQKTVKISGVLSNFSSQVLVEDLSEYQYLKPQSTDRIVIPGPDGKFTIQFPLSSPDFFRMGRNILYLSPGDDLTVSINYNNNKLATFTGTGAQANTYLSETPFPKGGSFLEAGSVIQPDAKATFDLIMAAAAKRTETLNATTGISPEFKRLETARIKADVLNSFASVPVYLKIMKKVAQPEPFLAAFNDLTAPVTAAYSKNFIDPSLMKMVVYRDIADALVAAEPANPKGRQISDWYTASSIVKRMESENDKAKLALFRKNIDSISTPGYRQAVSQYFATLLRFGKGDPAMDFKAVAMDGRKVSLSDLKGKVIYVDLWATWCGPCLAEMPHYEELKAKFEGNPDVVFVSLSIDDDHAIDKWKQNVVSRKAGGIQWQIDRNKLNAYNIVGIPRTLLIDKNFKIVNMNAPLPSAKNVEDTIRKLL